MSQGTVLCDIIKECIDTKKKYDIMSLGDENAETGEKKSESKIYHIMLRGINQQQIFEEDEDYWKLLKIIEECKALSCFQVYAYCIMGNHVHLLICEGNECLEQIIKRIGVRYVRWYNTKYRRVGHLFQDRFKSEPIDSKEYLLTVLRYIHQNPVKAKICNNAEEYLYSSYREYLRDSWLIDKEYLFSLIGKEAFIAFHSEPSNDKCLDIEENNRIQYTDEQAKKIIEKVSKCSTVTEFQALDKEKRNRYLTILRKNGLSIRQISRLTGVSFSIVKRV